jgi:outer membrane protein assembly factor BamB
LNPAVIHDGLVIVAPDDALSIYAFDATTGRLVWKSREVDKVSHVLGVAKGRLIATGNYVYSLDVKTGKTLRVWPDVGTGKEGFGRGLLAGDFIYWPTKSDILILSQETGGLADKPPIPLSELYGITGGNLAVGDGYLVVAQRDALVVFCQNSRLIERYREEIARAPDFASNYLRLARVAEATGQDDLALENLDSAIAKARPSETIDGQPLAESAQTQRFRLLMKLGARATEEKNWKLAARRYQAAARVAHADRDRLTAKLRLAEAQDADGEARAAVVTLQGLLADEKLRQLSVAADSRRTVRADLLITDRLAGLLKAKGREIYADYDHEAQEYYERGKATKDRHLLEEIGHSFPVAKVVPDALLELAVLQENVSANDAARAYKRLLAVAQNDGQRARALWGLGRSYEARKLWVPARDAFTRALSRYSEVRIEENGVETTVGSLVTERLSQEPFNRMTGDRSEPSVRLPIARRWNARWDGTMKPIAADGVPPSQDASRIFVAERTKLRPVDPNSGRLSWSADLEGEPIWVGYLADRVLAATSSRLVALDLRSGNTSWTFHASDSRTRRRAPNPFIKLEPNAERTDSAPGRLHDFRIVGGRVLCQRGDRDLLAVDGDSGFVEWSFAPATGTLNPRLLVDPQRVVLQVRSPNAIVLLDTDTGHRRAEFHQGDEEQAWARDPLTIDDDRIAVVVDERNPALFDLNKGIYAWTYREIAAVPKSGPPRLFGDSGRLFALRDGREVVRLDPATGVKLWSQVLGIEDLSEWPDALALDGDRLFCVCGQATNATLTSYNLSDGSIAWRQLLSGPPSGWAVALTERSVAVYPSPGRSVDGDLDGLPIAFFRRTNGQLVQRLLLPAPVTDLAVRLAPHSALVATQAGAWALGEWQPMAERNAK